MRNRLTTLALTATALTLASASANAANSTTATIALTATVASFDNITCTQTTLDLNAGAGITASGQTTSQPVNCQVSSNETNGVTVTAYLPTAGLTGTTATNTIAATAISWSATAGGTGTPFAALTGDLSDYDGAVVDTIASAAQGTNVAANFYLSLNVPAAQAADTYSGTLTVAITPTT